MSVSKHPVEPDYYQCNSCGGHYPPPDIFAASSHGKEWVCTGCAADYLANGSWPR